VRHLRDLLYSHLLLLLFCDQFPLIPISGFQNTLYSPKFAVSICLNRSFFANFCSHATSCTPCTKAKAACKSFDVNKACTKAKAEMDWRSRVRKTKQQTDTEWKTEVLRKLEELSELLSQMVTYYL